MPLRSILAVCMLFLSSTISADKFDADWHTYSNYQDIVSTHIHLDLAVDFKNKQLKGSITHDLKRLKKGIDRLILDTRDLDIHKVEISNGKSWKETTFELARRDDVKGSKLSIKLPMNATEVKVYYNSRPEASGLQWLSPIQTAGKKRPFMFSQSQAIHARSWMPIQDTPAMRVSYTATVSSDPTLRPIMSAENDPKWNKNGIYKFSMPQPIPTYLIAIAAGNIHYKSMSKQTAVYAEPELLESAAKEFEDTQAMIDSAEKLYGKYRWTDYDLLILPPSFPFGGMENPRLSFITPTVIAGDKSLVSLIAHELAHSWSGNLVTNATWRDLWLNEGFTSYVENRIMEEVFGERRAVMEQALAAQGLDEELVELPKGDTILHVVIEGRDPDDAFSGVPYTKGQLFLMYLEQKFGRDRFDAFLKKYFNDHAFQSIDTKNFLVYLDNNLLNKYPGIVSKEKVLSWVKEPMLPVDAPKPKSDAFTLVEKSKKAWLASDINASQIPTKKWTVHEWLYFINNLPKTITHVQLIALDNEFSLTQSTNNEIAHAWLLLNIKQGNPMVNERLESYMVSIGRRKLIVPLYKALLEKGSNYKFVKAVYMKARPGYHPLAQGSVDALFEKAK
ncbi:MAG: M1 family metallopeptidase [Kangiellaceae bacterium]|nr:M1 family metallopeptidase [Kangiellaceae bacterium]